MAKLKLIVNVSDNKCGALTNSMSTIEIKMTMGPQDSMSWSATVAYMMTTMPTRGINRQAR